MTRETVALIQESRCIGCTRCIDVCPVDAIVGARGLMHTVVEPWCIGCALCLPPCPVDCIDMVPARGSWTKAHKQVAGRRARRRKSRIENEKIKDRTVDRKAVLAATLARRRRP